MNKPIKIWFTLWAIAALGHLAGCASESVKPCASTPVEVKSTEIRYVPIDTRLTAAVPDPGPKLVAGVTVGDALASAANRANALRKANQRLVCIAAIQGRGVEVLAPSSCGADLNAPIP